MSIRADRRQIVAQRDPEGIAAFIAAAGDLRRAQVAFAHAAARIDANAAFVYDAGRLVLEGWKDGHPVFRAVDDGDGSSDDDRASQVAESAPVYGRAPAERSGVVKSQPRSAWPEGTSDAPAAWESPRDRARDPRPPPQESEAA